MYIKDTLKASISGNAGTATKLATARTITVGSTGKTFDGSGNVSWTLAEIGASASGHTHSYLPLSGGSLTGSLTVGGALIVNTAAYNGTTAYTSTPTGLSYKPVGDTANGALSTYSTILTVKESDNRQFQLNVDNGGSAIAFRSAHVNNTGGTGTGWSSWRKIYHEGNKPTPADIGAAASSHTHNYLPLSGGNVSGSIHLSTDNTKISGVCGGGTDRWNIQGGGTSDNGYLEISTADNGNEPIYVRQYDSNGLVRTAALLDGSGATSFPGLISEGGTKLTDKYAAKSHGHNSLSVKDAPYSSSNDTTSNWGSQGVSVSWYPDGTTITNKPNSWGFIFNIGRGTEVHQMWFTQATGTAYHRGGNGSGWSGSWRAFLDEANFSSYAAPASHSHSYLSTGGGTLSGPVQVSGESKFHNGTYSDPLNGTACAIKVTGKIAATDEIISSSNIRVNGKRLSITASAPGSPSTGDIWIDI